MAEAGAPQAAPPVLTWQEKLARAQQYRTEGNALYQADKYKGAIGKYHRALLYVRGIEGALQGLSMGIQLSPQAQAAGAISEAGKTQMDQLKMACYNNLAACLLKGESPVLEKVVQHCDQVLSLAPSNVKALYRKGQALLGMGDLDAAQEVLTRAVRLPEGGKDVKIRQLLQECSLRQTEEDAKVRQTYKGMFEQLSLDQNNHPNISCGEGGNSNTQPNV